MNENRSTRGGNEENIGLGWRYLSHPPAVRMRSRYYEEPDTEKVLYNPKGEVISRVVDKEPKMGFRP